MLDLSSNKLRDVPPELGDILTLSELLLNNNCLSRLPCELGRLFQLKALGLSGNPLPPRILSLCNEPNGTQKLLTYLQDNLHDPSSPLPERQFITTAMPDRTRSTAQFTVMCYNVLCDKYCTRQLYGYCPPWALTWDYRKKRILHELHRYNADIISLQEVETEQFYSFFQPELEEHGYCGVFSAKSRARTMAESERKHVDGCAIFYRSSKFRALKDHLIEFNQVAIEAADGQHDMINRVMTKDNIGLGVMLETTEAAWRNGVPGGEVGGGRQVLLVATCHVHWDPEFCDVKLIQTMMLMHKLQSIIKDYTQQQMTSSTSSGATESHTSASNSCDSLTGDSLSGGGSSIPLILCGDLNSLPESGVVEYLTSGRITVNHKDFKAISYEDCLHKLSHVSETKDMYSHGFRLTQAYNKELMPYTNYTFDFKGVIDYIFCSRDRIRTLGVLGGPELQWFEENRVVGCPHPQIPSDHFPLFAQFEMTPPISVTNPPAPPSSSSRGPNPSSGAH